MSAARLAMFRVERGPEGHIETLECRTCGEYVDLDEYHVCKTTKPATSAQVVAAGLALGLVPRVPANPFARGSRRR